MTIITNSPLTNYNNAAIQKNVASFKAATIPDIQNDTIEIQGKKRGLSKGAKIGIGLGAVGSIAIAIALLAKGKSSQAKEALQHLDFKEAKNIEEAVKWGKENLGIKNYDLDNLEVINWVNKGLSDIFNHSKGKATMPISVISDAELIDKGAIAMTAYVEKLGGHYININPEFIKNIDSGIKKRINVLLKNKSLSEKDNIYKLSDFLQSGEEAKKIEQLLNKYKGNPNAFSWNDKMLLHDSLRNVNNVCAKINLSPLETIKNIFKSTGLKDISWTTKNGGAKQLTFTDIEALGTKEQAEILKTLIKGSNGKVVFNIKPANPYHTIYHELGHLQHEKAAKAAYNKMGSLEELKEWGITDNLITKEFINNAKEQQIAAGISYYATKSPLEFVAETYAEILRGTKISDEAKELYKRFKGPAFSV